MEYFKNLLSPLSERAKSPFYGSFIVSWLLWNWRIVILILFPNRESAGGENLTEYIYSTYINAWDSLYTPLIITAIYIIVLPWFDYFVVWYSEFTKRTKIDKKIEIGRKHKVEGNLYYDLKLRFEEEREKILKVEEELNKEKSKLKEKENEYSTLLIQHENFKKNEKKILEKLTLLEKRHHIEDFFQGRWTLMYDKPTPRGITIEKEEIFMVNDEYRIIRDNKEFSEFYLKLIDLDLYQKRFSFVKFRRSDNRPHSIVELGIISNERFEGKENETINVTYTKNVLNLNIPSS